MNKYLFLPLFCFLLIIGVFFYPFFVQGKLPIPSDTIVGLYHPYRDLYADDYPNGIAYKNYLVTDPVRQQLPWRYLGIESLKQSHLPLWNQYEMSGIPLLGNFQSALLYPLNILFFLLSFEMAWSTLVILQPFLAMTFMFLYLRNLRIDQRACFLGGIVYGFCGFSVAWLEWNTIGHVALWLPLILLTIDKVFAQFSNYNSELKIQKYYVWFLIFIFSLCSAFFAGHVQTFFYLFLVSLAYIIVRWVNYGKPRQIILPFAVSYLLFAVVTAIQWIPTLQFIQLSARNVDLNWQMAGWFIPGQHLVQFLAPDYFGNPTTLNFRGVWNYAELVGYIGIFPLVCALYALYSRRDKKTIFFGSLFFLSLIFALPTFLAKIPYLLQIPFLSTSQPTRLLFITDFSLSILAALGLDYAMKSKRSLIIPLVSFGLLFAGLWIFTLFLGSSFSQLKPEDMDVGRRNLIFPTIIFVIVCLAVFLLQVIKNKKVHVVVMIGLLVVTIFDLYRFMTKFTPFTDKRYLFPQTQSISFLQKQPGQFRVMTTDDRILPPNFSTFYRIQSVDGYDPLYLRRHGELIVASERGKPDIAPPFGFNRIIAPHNFETRIIDLLGVKYILSLTELASPKLTKVFEEGQTRVYENIDALPRTYFVKQIDQVSGDDKQQAIEKLFRSNLDLRNTAIVEDTPVGEEAMQTAFSVGIAQILDYNANKIVIQTENAGDGFLILSDSYYPTWHAKIYSGEKTFQLESKIYRVNYAFRGIHVPKGNHIVEFTNSLL